MMCKVCKKDLASYYFKYGIKTTNNNGEISHICEECSEIQLFDWELSPKINYKWGLLTDRQKKRVMGYRNGGFQKRERVE